MKDKNEYGKNWKKEIIDEIVDSARINPKYVETSMNYLIKKIETDKETKEFLVIINRLMKFFVIFMRDTEVMEKMKKAI